MFLDTVANLYRSRQNLFLDSSSLEQLEIRKLRRILDFAYGNVSFYHEKLRGAGIKPEDVRKLDDIMKIPFTTKKEIQNTPLRDMVARGVDLNKCIRNRTSGSTGLSLTTIAAKKTDDYDTTMWLRAYFLNGMRLRDKMIVVKDLSAHPEPPKRWVEHFGIMQRKYISVFENPKKMAKFFTNERPEIIQSYPSSLLIAADLYEDLLVAKPRLVFTYAELLDSRSRNSIAKAFEANLFDYYGSSEIGLMSWECKEHSNYHINADNIIMEFIGKDDEILALGEDGEIVCTNLYNYEMPLIRYRQEDIGAAIAEKCACGVKLPLMRIAGGRKDDFLKGTDGRIIPPTIFYPFPFDNFEKIRQFRVIQESRNKLKIQLVVKLDLDDYIFEKARKNIRRVFGKDMEVEFEMLEDLPRDPSGKFRKIISRI